MDRTRSAEEPERGKKPMVDFNGNLKVISGEDHLIPTNMDGGHTCDRCGQTFTFIQNLKAHLCIFNSERPYGCNQCGQTFTSMHNFKDHLLLHNGEKPYGCDQCGRTFTQLSILKTHQLIHSGEKPYECDQCGKSFARMESLRIHLFIHSGERPHKCDQCGKTFIRKDDLKRHLPSHSEEKPYSCDQCGKAFKVRSYLKEHQVVHTGERPYNCDQCGKAFTFSGSLRSHQRIHRREKSYFYDQSKKTFSVIPLTFPYRHHHHKKSLCPCDKCTKKRWSSNSSKRHQRTRTGKKPYQCRFCDRSFITGSQCTKHERFKHLHKGQKKNNCTKMKKDSCRPRRSRIISSDVNHQHLDQKVPQHQMTRRKPVSEPAPPTYLDKNIQLKTLQICLHRVQM